LIVPLELRYDHGQTPRLLQDGKEVKGVELVVIEADPEGVRVEIQMKPLVITELLNGAITWLVGCPNCAHNSIHTCEIDDSKEPVFRKVEVAEVPIP
jgi:hypothetical protein